MTKDQIPSRLPIPLPFAIDGETDVRNPEIDPLSASSSSKYFDASYQWNGTTNPSKFITRQLINKLFAQMSGRQFLQQCGYIDTFDEKVCKAIGGYPQGAVLQYLDGDVLYDVVSMRDNNNTDYTKVGVDGINWRIYGSSVFSYVYPDYGSIGQENILKTWDVSDIGWSFVFQGGSEELRNAIYVSSIRYDETDEQWILVTNYKDNNNTYFIYYNGASPDATSITFTGGRPIQVVATKNEGAFNYGILSGDLTIHSQCWIQAFITNPTAASAPGLTNYECGIALYNESTARPSTIEDLKFSNTNYTVYELQEIGTIATAILPVLPGNKISAFSSEIPPEDRKIIIRKLTPVRTR